MINKDLIAATAGALMLASTASAQTVPFPTSESVVGNYDTPIVIIPASSVPQEPVSFESQQSSGNGDLIVTVSSAALTELDLNLPRSQADLLNIIAFSAFGAPLDSITEGASDIEGEIPELPTAGSATFSGLASGTVVNAQGAFDVNGDVTVDVDFAAGTVATAFTDMQRQTVTENGLGVAVGTTAWRDFSSVGSFVNDTALFSGSAATTDGLLTGSVAGMVSGSESASGMWSLAGDGEEAIGGFTATAD